MGACAFQGNNLLNRREVHFPEGAQVSEVAFGGMENNEAAREARI